MSAVERVQKDTSPGANNANLHEEGGHSVNGEVTDWDAGSTRKVDKGGSISVFNGVEAPMEGDLHMSLAVDTYWHVHTSKVLKKVDSNGNEVSQTGSANPSEADYRIQRGFEEHGFRGYAIQVGTVNGSVNFYRGNGIFRTISLKAFKRAVGN